MRLNTIYHGDNLYFMADMPDESIDLIYIDPPFGTQSLWQSHAFQEKVQELQFYDIWGGGVNGYVEFMVERLRHMHKLLKPTGSLFVHLDWRMSHYIKIELDKIFAVLNPASNATNFVNEIIWCYKSGGASAKRWARKHDTILFYAKDKRFRGFYQPLKQHGRGIYISSCGYTNKAKERAAGWRMEGLDMQLLTVEDVLNGNYREQRA